jgi:hypothetical protein
MKRFVLSDLTLSHENTHFDDWTRLKYSKPPQQLKNEYKKIIRQNRKKLSKVKKPNKSSPLLNTNEKDMQILIVARMMDDKMWDYIKKNHMTDTKITEIAINYYSYISPYELRARLSEFSAIHNSIKCISNVQDTSVKKRFLETLNTEILIRHKRWLDTVNAPNLTNDTKAKSYLADYFEMCKVLIKENFKQNSGKLFEDYKNAINEYINELSIALDNLKKEIDIEMDKISMLQLQITMSHKKETLDAVKFVIEKNASELTNRFQIAEIKKSLSEMCKNFDLELIKNISIKKSNNHNNILIVATKLEELNDFADKCLEKTDADDIKLFTKNLATKILNSEKEIMLIASGAYEKIKSISETEIDKEKHQSKPYGKLLEIYQKMKKENIAKTNETSSINQPRTFKKVPAKDNDLEL